MKKINGMRCQECNTILNVIKTYVVNGTTRVRMYACPKCRSVYNSDEKLVVGEKK